MISLLPSISLNKLICSVCLYTVCLSAPRRLANIAYSSSVRQLQATQHSIQDVEFLLVVARALSNEDKQKLIELFRTNLHPEMNITIREVDDIPRSVSGKYEDFISML